jgi:hypothetical protein
MSKLIVLIASSVGTGEVQAARAAKRERSAIETAPANLGNSAALVPETPHIRSYPCLSDSGAR